MHVSIEIVEWLKQFVVVVMVCLPRLLGVFMVLPAMAPTLLPRLVRNTIALSFVPCVFSHVANTQPAEISPFMLIGIMLKEFGLGFAMGYAASQMFWMFQSMGMLIDNQRGGGQEQQMDVMSGSDSSPTGNLSLQFCIVMFFETGGMTLLMTSVIESYVTWSIWQMIPSLNVQFALAFIQMSGQLLMGAVLMAAPMVIMMFLVTIAMGLINRFAPNLNVFILTMPIKSAFAMFMFLLCIEVFRWLIHRDIGKIPQFFNFLAGLL